MTRELTQEILDAVAEGAGSRHRSVSAAPSDRRSRELWGLVEILDWHCFDYGDAPCGLSQEEVQAYLLAHRQELLDLECEPPSYLGLANGILDFLAEARNS